MRRPPISAAFLNEPFRFLVFTGRKAKGDVGEVVGVSSSILFLLFAPRGLLAGSLSRDGGRPSSPVLRRRLNRCSIPPENVRLCVVLCGEVGVCPGDVGAEGELQGNFMASKGVKRSSASWSRGRKGAETVLRRFEASRRSPLPPRAVAVPSCIAGLKQAHRRCSRLLEGWLGYRSRACDLCMPG
jgi:hypothetical protein